jgi:Rha family phage regulatory protein
MTALILPSSKTTSLIIAEKFGKRHKDVLRKIEALDVPQEYHERNFTLMFEPTKIGNGASRDSKVYEMTRDGFSLLVMGFTGKQAMEWKIKFLEAFNAMERGLSEKPVLVKEHRRRKPAKRPAFTPEQFAASIPQEDLLLTAQGHLSDAAKRNSDHSLQLAHACLTRFKDYMDQPLSLTALYKINVQESRSTPMKRSA